MPANKQQPPSQSAASDGSEHQVTPGVQAPPPDITFTVPDPLLGTGSAHPPYTDRTLLTVQQSSSWQGPYPSPDAVERFEAILPGAFNRILTMAETAQDAEIRASSNAQKYLQSDVRRSNYLGAGISVLAVLCSTACALTDHTVAAVALVGIPVMAVARAFIKRGSDDTAADDNQAPPQPNNGPPPG